VTAFDVVEAQAYWQRVHAEALRTAAVSSEAQLLEPVCHPGWPLWFNSYVARWQRRAFQTALPHCGDLRGRDVLEIGCGTGRWTVLLRDLGARVHAVDVSPEVIDADRKRFSGVHFLCADLLNLPSEDSSVDLAVSVTVIQHVPHKAQDRAVAELARVVRSGGKALLLENTSDIGRHVFARAISEWKALFASHRFKCVYARGYSYDLPLRGARVLRDVGRRTQDTSHLDEEPLRQPTRLAALACRPLVAASEITERLSWRFLPPELATHCAFVFERVG
jgi:SAM-dependent methyltransferase